MNIKKNLIKGSLLIGFLLILIVLIFIKNNKTNKMLTFNKNTIFTYVTSDEILDVVTKESGVVLIINDRSEIESLVTLLKKLDYTWDIFVYNIRNEEEILEYTDNEIKVVQEPSKTYNELLKTLGFYTEDYVLYNEDGDIINTGKKRIISPLALFIKKGKILYSYSMIEEVTNEELIKSYNLGYDILNDIIQ